MSIPKGGVVVFDSGIGGLTTLAKCVELCKIRPFYYYGDNARAPYGNLSPERVRGYVSEIFEKLETLQPCAAVLACNTVTALCVEALRKKYAFPIIGAEPAVRAAAKRGGEIFVLATSATVQSAKFHALCQNVERKYPSARVRAFACPALAGAIENRLTEKNFDFTSFLPVGNPSSVVLGCTHYVFIQNRIGEFYHCPTFDGNIGIAQRLRFFVDNFPNPLHGLNCGEVSVFGDNCGKSREGQPLLSTIPPSGGKEGEIYFLGGSLVYNRTIFEQMFVNVRK